MRSEKPIYIKRWLNFLAVLVVVLIINTGASYFPLRIDLTADKRYTLHNSTKLLLSQLKAEVQVDIYLAGDLPTEFKQLQQNTKNIWEEFKAYASYPINYRLVNIETIPVEERKEIFKKLQKNNIEPTNLYRQAKGQRTEKIIYPAAIITYQDKETGVMLLQGNKMASSTDMVGQSIENLEYECIKSLAKLVTTSPLKIGLVKGHGEPSALQLHGFIRAISGSYELQEVYLTSKADLIKYQALLITKPRQAFSELEKYALDQYIMQGGKVLFFLDKLEINMDSLVDGRSFAFPLDLNLDDQLFKYGIRINPDLIKDKQAGVYPVIVGKMGNQPQLKFFPWPFFPIINHFGNHIITKNTNALYIQFASSLDTIQVKGVAHTALALSSPYSIKAGTPVFVDLESLRNVNNSNLYNQGPIPIAYLLEGRFTSLYKNRLVSDQLDTTGFMDTSIPTKLLVVSSGSIVINAISSQKKEPLPWGYDPFLQQNFANQDLVLNTLAYMLEEKGFINAKSKVVKLRLLDKVRIEEEKLFWQLYNLLIPIFILTLIGIIWYISRKRKYKV